MAALRWGWWGGRCYPVLRCRRGGMAENAAYKRSKTKKAPLCSGAFLMTADLNRDEKSLLFLRGLGGGLRGGGLGGGRRRSCAGGGRVHLHAGVHRCRGRSHGRSGGVGG